MKKITLTLLIAMIALNVSAQDKNTTSGDDIKQETPEAKPPYSPAVYIITSTGINNNTGQSQSLEYDPLPFNISATIKIINLSGLYNSGLSGALNAVYGDLQTITFNGVVHNYWQLWPLPSL